MLQSSAVIARYLLGLGIGENKAGHHNAPRTTISQLNDDVLLHIFNQYRLDSTTDDSDSGWDLQRWWYKLIHVCRVWRLIILARPNHLDLHLVCTYGTPIEAMLSHSPPFPLIIYYPGKRSTTMSEEDKHGAKVALQQRERVHRVHIAAPASNLRDLVQVMNDEYPNLKRLLIRAQAEPRADRRNRNHNRNRNDAVTVTLHEGLRAPLLHRVTLSNVGLPTSSCLLSGAGEDLVSLGLLNFPAEPPDFHPAHLTAQLAALSHLELLTVHFSTAVPNHQVMRQLQGAPTTRIALPRLRMLAYRGGSAYLEGILARLDAPHLHTLSVEFFNQLTFSIPSLLHFARAMNALTFRSAALYFDEDFASLIVDPLDKRAGDGGGGGTHPLHVQVKGKLLDWQVTSMSQICSTLAPLLAQTENLMLGFHKDGPDPAAAGAVEAEAPGAAAGWQVAVDRAQWRALFRIFVGVKTLQLSGGRIGDLFRALQLRVGEGNGGGEGEGADEEGTNDDGVDGGVFTPEILPALQKLLPRGWGDPDDAFASFIAARTAAGLPVRLVRSRS